MNEEFPRLELEDYQKDFLADWYSPRKLFKGERYSGKSELLLSELRRFERNGMSSLLIAPNLGQIKTLKRQYEGRFGEKMVSSSGTIHDIERGNFRGNHYDCILFDEVQEIMEDQFMSFMAHHPKLIRATASKSRIHNSMWLDDEPSFFDVVYTDE